MGQLTMFDAIIDSDYLVASDGYITNGFVMAPVGRYKVHSEELAALAARYREAGNSLPARFVGTLLKAHDDLPDMLVFEKSDHNGGYLFFDLAMVELLTGYFEAAFVFYSFRYLIDDSGSYPVPILTVFDDAGVFAGAVAGIVPTGEAAGAVELALAEVA